MVINEYFKILKFISIYSVLLPFVFAVIKLRILDPALRILLFYIFCSILSDNISLFLAYRNEHNYFIRNIFSITEVTCLCLIYILRFNVLAIKGTILFFLIFYLVLSFIILGSKGGINSEDNLLNQIEAIFFIIIGHIYIYRLFYEMKLKELSNDTFFWINNAILFYFTANLVLFLFYDKIVRFQIQRFYILHSLHLISNITFNVMLAIGIWKTRAKQLI